MRRTNGILILAVCLSLARPFAPLSLAQAQATEDKRVKQLEDEKKKLSGTTNPENRARSFMRIAEITLSYVSDAASSGDVPKMQFYVGAYQRAVGDARDTMMKSGIDPRKKSGDFKTIEIALRKHVRILRDIARLLTVDDRQSVDETIDIVSKIHDEFFHALFG